jgi:hypothetical protein
MLQTPGDRNKVASMKLFFSRNPNPRLAVAVARYLKLDIEYERTAPFAPGQADADRANQLKNIKSFCARRLISIVSPKFLLCPRNFSIAPKWKLWDSTNS